MSHACCNTNIASKQNTMGMKSIARIFLMYTCARVTVTLGTPKCVIIWIVRSQTNCQLAQQC